VRWRKHVSVDAMAAPNLEFMPFYIIAYDEQAWQTFAREMILVQDLDECSLLTQVKDWVTHGV
jgi:hypothetical protein